MDRTRLMCRARMFAGALLLAVAAQGGSGAGAQAMPPPPGPVVHVGGPQRFAGVVSTLIGSPTDPAEFTLQLGNLTGDVQVDGRTVFLPRSTEAQVEGFVAGDYAVVAVREVHRQWIARRISFDTQPFGPLRQFSGLIDRLNPAGTVVWLRPDSGRTVRIGINRNARLLTGDRPAPPSLTLTRGQAITVLCLFRDGWQAYDIDVRPPPPQPAR